MANEMSSEKPHSCSAILLIACPDQPGIVATVTEFIFKHNGNIIALEQHVDDREKFFFMRLEWNLDGFLIAGDEIGRKFQTLIAGRFAMQWTLSFSDEVPRIALFVSKQAHCLYDILARYLAGEWRVQIPLIVSNHPDLGVAAEKLGIDYHLTPITPANKQGQEKSQLELIRDYKIDVIVLARYMQILSEDFVTQYPHQIINIHHSFLPAFPGAKPYHSAFDRGVKIIGATSHYVTAELDAGPIIEQDVIRVSHTDSIEAMMRKGRDIEKLVLARAVWHHINHKIIVFRNRTIIFS
jgi:formyltetrahydrofolate deformylase